MTNTAIKTATSIGREHRKAYLAEFGEYPVRDHVGDWDTTGWGEAWRQIDDPTADHGICQLAYFGALFGEDDSPEGQMLQSLYSDDPDKGWD